ncbi:hypothetical protein CPB86DRAFT_781499 [Serendipita vermifera]|nr:hypothetical protein CPB86DRAFT_781499 [Serendipita vermifera]
MADNSGNTKGPDGSAWPKNGKWEFGAADIIAEQEAKGSTSEANQDQPRPGAWSNNAKWHIGVEEILTEDSGQNQSSEGGTKK